MELTSKLPGKEPTCKVLSNILSVGGCDDKYSDFTISASSILALKSPVGNITFPENLIQSLATSESHVIVPT